MWRALAVVAVVALMGTAHAQTQGDCYPNLPTALTSLGLTHTAALLPIGNLTKPVLDESLPLTFFAPHDDAWEQRSAQFGMVATAINTTAEPDTISYILQHHVVEGAAVDYTLPEAQLFPLSTDLSTSPCVAQTPVTVKVTTTPLGLLVQSEGTDALVTAQHTTCGGVSSIYVIDDVLNPCCTNMFDINKSPLLRPVFFSEDPVIAGFVDFLNGPLFDEETAAWTLPPTLFVPTAKALAAFLTTFNASPDMDNVTRNSVYQALVAMHQSDILITKESLLLSPANETVVTVPSALAGKLKQPNCTTDITVALGKPAATEAASSTPVLGTVSVGKVKANILKAYKMCNGTSLIVIDTVLVPCDLTKLGPCKQFFDIQTKPLVADAFTSTDADVKLFMNYFTKPLFVSGNWTLPSTLFMPTATAVAKYVADIKANSDLTDGIQQIVGNTTIYHMTNTVMNNETLAAGPVTGDTLLASPTSVACVKSITATRTAAGTTVTAGNNTATVLMQYSLCGNTTVFVIDSVLVPCNIKNLVPCTQFYSIQATPQLAPFFNSADTNVKTFANYFNNPLYDKKSNSWVLPSTVFLVSADPLMAVLKEQVGKDLNSDKAKKLYSLMMALYTSDTAYTLDQLLNAGSKGLTIQTRLVGAKYTACQTTMTTNATTLRGNSTTGSNQVQVSVTLGDTKANIIRYWQLCGNKNVFLLDAVLLPCNLDQLIKDYQLPKSFGKSAAPGLFQSALATAGAALAGAAMLAL